MRCQRWRSSTSSPKKSSTWLTRCAKPSHYSEPRTHGGPMSTNDDSAPMHEVLLAAVAQQTSALVVQAEHLANAATELKGAYRFSRQLKVIFATAATAMMLLLGLGVGLIVLATQNHDTGTQTREAVARTREAVAVI